MKILDKYQPNPEEPLSPYRIREIIQSIEEPDIATFILLWFDVHNSTISMENSLSTLRKQVDKTIISTCLNESQQLMHNALKLHSKLSRYAGKMLERLAEKKE